MIWGVLRKTRPVKDKPRTSWIDPIKNKEARGTENLSCGGVIVDYTFPDLLADVARAMKDRMEELGVDVLELSRRSGISTGRIRRVLRAQNSRLNVGTIVTLSVRLGMEARIVQEDLFVNAVRKGMADSLRERKKNEHLSDFQRRYEITRV